MADRGRPKSRILLIDNDADVLDVMAATLRHSGHQVTATTDPTEAIDLFAQDPYRFDLLIIDDILAVLPERGLAGKALTIRPDIAIILTTDGLDLRKTNERAQAARIKVVVMKPSLKNEIEEAIGRVLDIG